MYHKLDVVVKWSGHFSDPIYLTKQLHQDGHFTIPCFMLYQDMITLLNSKQFRLAAYRIHTSVYFFKLMTCYYTKLAVHGLTCICLNKCKVREKTQPSLSSMSLKQYEKCVNGTGA